MGFFDFFRKAASSVGNFFNKSVAAPVGNFFKKGGMGEQVLGGISQGLGTVGNIASQLASNPLVTAGITALAPELLPALPALALGGKLAQQGSQATNLNNYSGQDPTQIAQNVLERANKAGGTIGPKFSFY